MQHPPYEVLSEYASRYRVPKRRRDGSLKGEAELAGDIFGYEEALYKLDVGCFYEYKLGNNIIVRTAPLTLYPRDQIRKCFTETRSLGRSPAPPASSQSFPPP
jgi:hypothetical protein